MLKLDLDLEASQFGIDIFSKVVIFRIEIVKGAGESGNCIFESNLYTICSEGSTECVYTELCLIGDFLVHCF